MFKNRYRTNQLIVEARATMSSRKVVIFMVNVRLVERKVNSHVGNFMVRKLSAQ